MPGAGAFDRRVTVERRRLERTALNEPRDAWDEVGTFWARRRDQSDAERLAAGREVSSPVTRFTLRASPASRAIMASDRIVHDGHAWDIEGIKEMAVPARRYIEVTARRGEAVPS